MSKQQGNLDCSDEGFLSLEPASFEEAMAVSAVMSVHPALRAEAAAPLNNVPENDDIF